MLKSSIFLQMRELMDQHFGNEGQIDVEKFGKLYDTLDAQRNEEANRWKQQTKYGTTSENFEIFRIEIGKI